VDESPAVAAALHRRIAAGALSIGAATGVYAISFGAVSVAAGLSVWQTCALSLLMFSGASQYAFVALAGNGVAAVATAALLGARNGLYGLRLSSILRPGRLRRLATAQLVIDESTAMALGHEADGTPAARRAFWATGSAVFVFWNALTLVGALVAGAIPDPKQYGLDAVAPAAFLALLAPRLRGRGPVLTALVAGVVALALTPAVPAGVPVLVAAAVAVLGVFVTKAPAAPPDPEAAP
jgi:predicted branched-subunit amino acid permease